MLKRCCFPAEAGTFEINCERELIVQQAKDGGFFPENGQAAAGVRYLVPESQGRGRNIGGKFRGSHPGQTSRMAEKNPET